MPLVLRAVVRHQLPEISAYAQSPVQLWCQSSTGWASHHGWWQCLTAVPSSGDHVVLQLHPFPCHCQNKCLPTATIAMIFFLHVTCTKLCHNIGCLYYPFYLSMIWPFIYDYPTFMRVEVFAACCVLLSVYYIARLTLLSLVKIFP